MLIGRLEGAGGGVRLPFLKCCCLNSVKPKLNSYLFKMHYIFPPQLSEAHGHTANTKRPFRFKNQNTVKVFQAPLLFSLLPFLPQQSLMRTEPVI